MNLCTSLNTHRVLFLFYLVLLLKMSHFELWLDRFSSLCCPLSKLTVNFFKTLRVLKKKCSQKFRDEKKIRFIWLVIWRKKKLNFLLFNRNIRLFIQIIPKYLRDKKVCVYSNRSILSIRRKILLDFYPLCFYVALKLSAIDVFIRTRTAWFSLIQGTAHHI